MNFTVSEPLLTYILKWSDAAMASCWGTPHQIEDAHVFCMVRQILEAGDVSLKAKKVRENTEIYSQCSQTLNCTPFASILISGETLRPFSHVLMKCLLH